MRPKEKPTVSVQSRAAAKIISFPPLEKYVLVKNSEEREKEPAVEAEEMLAESTPSVSLDSRKAKAPGMLSPVEEARKKEEVTMKQLELFSSSEQTA